MRYFALIMLACGIARAEGSAPFPFTAMLELSAAYHFTSPAADGVANLAYDKRFKSGFEGTMRLGAVVGPLYLGIAYEYWSASRRTESAGVTTTDVLNYQLAGGEVGLFIHANPRVYWLLTATVYYPLKAEIHSSTTASATLYAAPKRLPYQGRAAIGFKLARRLSALFEGGYRLGNLGPFSSSGTLHPTLGGSLDFTGPFAGVGLAVHF